jgi:hypothetical protein
MLTSLKQRIDEHEHATVYLAPVAFDDPPAYRDIIDFFPHLTQHAG